MNLAILLAALAIPTAAFAHEVIHVNHVGVHAESDGHLVIMHDGHADHLHDGHLHSVHGDHVDEHVLEITAANPADESLGKAEDTDHMHGSKDCEHPRIQHGDHIDYIHDGHLHHVHGDHVDEHGAIQIK